MAKEDFGIGLLKGLYESGVGNPAVGRQRALEDVFMRQQMAEAGIAPASPSPDVNPSVMQKVLMATHGILFPGGGGMQGYRPDPNAPGYFRLPTGEVVMTEPGKVPPPNALRLSRKEGSRELGIQHRSETSGRSQLAGFDEEGNAVIFDPGMESFKKTRIEGVSGPLLPKTSSNPIKAARDLDVYTDIASKALLAIEKIRNAGAKIPDIQPGLVSQTLGRATTALKSYSKNPEITFYQGAVAQELIPLARNLAEEKGPITEYDVTRIDKGLGDITTPLATRNALLDELVNKIELGIKNKSQTSGVTVESVLSRNTSLADLLARQKKFQSGGALPSDKQRRLEELRRKRDEGTLK